MHCMKCGRQIAEEQSFCGDCLEVMEKYPINPNATVTIPQRPAISPTKKRARRARDFKPEEQIRRLRLVIRCLIAALTVTLAAFFLMTAMLLHLMKQQDQKPDIGQNYGSATEQSLN